MDTPLPDLDATIEQYVNSSRLAENYDEYFADSALFAFDCLYLGAVLDFPHVPERRFSLLDLGCGTGRHLALAARNGCRATGVDLNPHMLAKARASLTRQGIPFDDDSPDHPPGTVRLLEGDIRRPPLEPEERFDAVIVMFSTFGLICKAMNRLAFLKMLRARLRPGGRLVLHVHNERHYQHHTSILSKRYLKEKRLQLLGKLDAGDHMQYNYRGVLDLRLHFFTSEEVRDLVASAGFRLLDFLYLNDERNGSYDKPDKERRANGFLVTAERGFGEKKRVRDKAAGDDRNCQSLP